MKTLSRKPEEKPTEIRPLNLVSINTITTNPEPLTLKLGDAIKKLDSLKRRKAALKGWARHKKAAEAAAHQAKLAHRRKIYAKDKKKLPFRYWRCMNSRAVGGNGCGYWHNITDTVGHGVSSTRSGLERPKPCDRKGAHQMTEQQQAPPPQEPPKTTEVLPQAETTDFSEILDKLAEATHQQEYWTCAKRWDNPSNHCGCTSGEIRGNPPNGIWTSKPPTRTGIEPGAYEPARCTAEGNRL